MVACTCAVARAKGEPFTVEELDLDDPLDDEVLIEIAGVGICHTDMIIRDQYFPTPLPIVLGHEGSGVVVKIGSGVTRVAVGDHVVLAYDACWQCANCLSGHANYCIHAFSRNFGGRRPDGSTVYVSKSGEKIGGYFFAQSSFGNYALATERNCVKIDKNVPLEIMGPLACGLMTGAGTVMNTLKPEAGSSIVIFGTGAVGLAAIMAARAVGCGSIIAVDILDSRLALAKELGATATINGSTGNTVESVQALTDGLGAHFSIDTTGNPKVFRQAQEAIRVTGVCALLGAAPFGTEVTFDQNSFLFGRTVKGVVSGDSVPQVFIPRLIELWKQGRFPFDKLLKFYDFDSINEACADSESGAVLKPVLRPAKAVR